MKAYQIKIELLYSDPLIWRRVIMPADATFNRLNDVIQTVTNFKSGYPYGNYHLYEFDLAEENIKVTNDEESYEEHKYFMKNQELYEERLESMPESMAEFERIHIEELKKIVRKPVGIKIDDYLEKYGEIKYIYDFGDYWEFLIILEKTIYDYKVGYPTVVDGAETAPPEDVGGLGGYYEFLEIYNNPKHPQHEEMVTWARKQGYMEYDIERLNSVLTHIRYKKND